MLGKEIEFRVDGDQSYAIGVRNNANVSTFYCNLSYPVSVNHFILLNANWAYGLSSLNVTQTTYWSGYIDVYGLDSYIDFSVPYTSLSYFLVSSVFFRANGGDGTQSICDSSMDLGNLISFINEDSNQRKMYAMKLEYRVVSASSVTGLFYFGLNNPTTIAQLPCTIRGNT